MSNASTASIVMMRGYVPRMALFVVGILALTLCQVALNRSLRGMDTSWVEPPDVGASKTDPRLFKAFTFGHWTVGVDWLWIRSLQEQELEHVPRGTHAPVYYAMDLATDLDPAFFEVYWAGTNYLAIVRDDVTGSLNLVEKGIQFIKQDLNNYPESFRENYWEGSWNLYLLLAYLKLFEFNNMLEAANAFQEAASLPGSSKYLTTLARRLRAPGGQYEVGIRLLSFMITGLKDTPAGRQSRKVLERKRSALLVSQYLFLLNENFHSYLQKIPGYRSKISLSAREMDRYWHKFVKETNAPMQDPLGGQIKLDASGRVESTTPQERVFGLE